MRYRFAKFELDTDRLEFRAGSEVRALEPQVFDVLRHLVEHAERLVSREELINVVWGGRIVSDATVSARINSVRKAVDDDGSRQRVVKTIPRRGFRFLLDVRPEGACDSDVSAHAEQRHATPITSLTACRQQIVRICRSYDGTQIAYAAYGSGLPLVRAGTWLTHLEYDWQGSLVPPFLEALSDDFTIYRYDQRGNGLSDWQVHDFGLEALVADLAAVVDASKLDHFPLFANSQGVPVAIAYTAQHPDRVTRLILQGGFSKGRLVRADSAEREQASAILTLMRHSWGQRGHQFVQAYGSMFIPDGTAEQIASLADLQRHATTADNAVQIRQSIDNMDVSHLLGQIRAPTLVLHSENDAIQPIDQGRSLAAGIPGARFLVLKSRNHIILSHEPAWDGYIQTIKQFLS